jgi:hypothetical protein
MDTRAPSSPDHVRRFWNTVWPEAAREFGRSGIQFKTSDGPGEIQLSPGDRPMFVGLERGALNLILTDHLPMSWDQGRALGGVAMLYGPYHLCLLSLRYAHGNQVPFISLNTCTHELLHALLGDIFIRGPKWYVEGEHEFRIDWYATRLWLFGARGIRPNVQQYLERLRRE